MRFIGDRSIQEKDFGRIQIDRVLEMQKWADNIKAIQNERVKLAIVAANNHYAGFGPGTANMFRNMLGLPEAKWEVSIKVQACGICRGDSSTKEGIFPGNTAAPTPAPFNKSIMVC